MQSLHLQCYCCQERALWASMTDRFSNYSQQSRRPKLCKCLSWSRIQRVKVRCSKFGKRLASPTRFLLGCKTCCTLHWFACLDRSHWFFSRESNCSNLGWLCSGEKLLVGQSSPSFTLFLFLFLSWTRLHSLRHLFSTQWRVLATLTVVFSAMIQFLVKILSLKACSLHFQRGSAP